MQVGNGICDPSVPDCDSDSVGEVMKIKEQRPMGKKRFAQRVKQIAERSVSDPKLARERIVLEMTIQLESLGYGDALKPFWKLPGPRLPGR